MIFPHLPEEDAQLRALCLTRMKEESGGDPAPEIAKRLEQELATVSTLGMSGVMLILHELFVRSDLPRSLISCRGALGASYVAWLCGLTPFDPLKARLPLYPEFFYRVGPDGNLCPGQMDFNVPVGTAEALFALLKSIEGVGDVVPMQDSSGSAIPNKRCIIPAGEKADSNDLMTGQSPYFALFLHESEPQTLLAKLAAETGISPEEIDLEDRDVLELFRNAAHTADPDCIPDPLSVIGLADALDPSSRTLRGKAYIQPESFADLVRIHALTRSTGVWENNQEELVRAGTISLSELICTREDVYEYCRDRFGFSAEDALYVADWARMGHGVSGMWERNIHGASLQDFLRFKGICDRIGYLFPRAHCYAFMLTVWRCAWYRVHHPETYSRVSDSVFSLRGKTDTGGKA